MDSKDLIWLEANLFKFNGRRYWVENGKRYMDYNGVVFEWNPNSELWEYKED